MKILILGAAGRIGKIVTHALLEQTDLNLVLYARGAKRRIKHTSPRVALMDADFSDKTSLKNALENVDIVYINHMGDAKIVEQMLSVIKTVHVKKIIVASILGIYDEVAGEFGAWNKRMVGEERIESQKECAKRVENLGIDYTILRLTWLYNDKNNTSYTLTQRGEPFVGAQVTREAVSQLIVDIVKDQSGTFKNTSIGVSEPNTDWPKPGFY